MGSKNSDLINRIDGFAGRKILVLGEAMLDSYLQGTSERLCQEAPVPIVDVREIKYVPGGAANAVVNLSALGAEVTFLSVIGEDEAGTLLLQSLKQRHVSTARILNAPNRTTLSKQRILAGSQLVVRFDQGSSTPLDTDMESKLMERLKTLYYDCEALVISDYNHGLITRRVLECLAELQRSDPRVIVVDSKQLQAYVGLNPTAVKANYEESLQVLGIKKAHEDKDRLRQISDEGRNLLHLTGAQIAAITLDHSGALIFHGEDETPYRTYAEPRPDSQAAGAGDTFVSALAMSLAAGAHVEHAAEIASAAAAVVVSKSGTSACALDELKEYFSTDEKFINDVFQLALRVTLYRRSGRRIVFTNGCFDILHRGHIAYLNRAKALGDVLILGINSDQSIRRLKGPERPINSLEDRAQVLAALSCVDHIVPFDSDTPHDLIRRVKPDIFVKGGDYTRETLPEAALVDELGGRVEILPYLESYSTTSVIEKIRHILDKR
ncbi:MAG TPA: D-glycero-beta-D-manno-heptose 1-phosphate adenylyltransferase [Anaerolineales bacterium]|nr:D-glycero-beta-D-manno-heptose 1-phosphate adenylyltransferase [Anaerolineales bacterium]